MINDNAFYIQIQGTHELKKMAVGGSDSYGLLILLLSQLRNLTAEHGAVTVKQEDRTFMVQPVKSIAPKTRFEYLSLQVSLYRSVVHYGTHPHEIVEGSIPELLSMYGNEGWELVSVVRIAAPPEAQIGTYSLYTFKRPLAGGISDDN